MSATQKQLPKKVFIYISGGMGAIACDLAEFRDIFLDIDMVANSAKAKWTRLQDTIHDAVNRHIPMKTITHRYLNF